MPHTASEKNRYDAMAVLQKALSNTQGGSALVKVWTVAPAEPVVITPPTLAYEPAIRHAISSQLAIGWVNLFRGFVSQAWGHIYYAAGDTTLLSERHTRATSHTSPAIMAVQDYAIAIWQHRNSVLCEAESQGMASIHATLNHSIVQIYRLKETFTPIIQSYFALPLEDPLCASPRQRARWLTVVQLATSHASARGSLQALVSHYFAHSMDAGTSSATTASPGPERPSTPTATSALSTP